MQFQVKLFNDGKEKWQSHEASFTMNSPVLSCRLIVDGYGVSKQDALNEMVQNLETLQQDLLVAIKQIKDGTLEGEANE